MFGKNKKKYGHDSYSDVYQNTEDEVANSEWHKQLDQFAEEIHTTFKDTGSLGKVVYQPYDDLKGSVSIYMKFLPEDHYLKIWLHQTQIGYAFFRKMHGAMEMIIPETFSDSGIGTTSDLDEFLDMFTDMIARKTYNMENTKTYE